MEDDDLEESEEREEFCSPFYLLTGSEPCWKCKLPQTVVGLAARSEDCGEDSEPFLLHEIETMPDEFLAEIQRLHPQYQWRNSYFANTCQCGAHFGDHYLFSEPGGAFFPSTEEEAAKIKIQELPFTGTFTFVCNPGYGIGGFILEHGERVAKPS